MGMQKDINTAKHQEETALFASLSFTREVPGQAQVWTAIKFPCANGRSSLLEGMWPQTLLCVLIREKEAKRLGCEKFNYLQKCSGNCSWDEL